MRQEIIKDLQTFKNDLKNKRFKKQLANILTSIRLLSPFVLIPLFYFNKLKIAFIMIIIFALTDAFDGYFARKYNTISTFGKYLDAFVDKVFALTILISLIIKTAIENNNFYLIILTIILELIISCINLYSFFKELKPSSTKWGKVKTNFLFSLLALLFLNKVTYLPNNLLLIFNVLTIILQLITIISYLFQIKKRKQTIVSL